MLAAALFSGMLFALTPSAHRGWHGAHDLSALRSTSSLSAIACSQQVQIGTARAQQQSDLDLPSYYAASQSYSMTVDTYTRLSCRTYDSFVGMPQGCRVPVLSLTNIEVASSRRREGRARKALLALIRSACDNRRALVIENVVSEHMHSLIQDLDGEPFPGSRAGARGCHYWIPGPQQTSWDKLAVKG